MGQFITPDDLPIPDPAEAVRLIDDVEVEALRRVPALVNVAKSKATVSAFRGIILRWKIEGPAAVTAQGAVSYSVGLSESRAGWVLTDDEVSRLKSLTPAGATSSSSGPLGSFPPGRVDRIFNADRRP